MRAWGKGVNKEGRSHAEGLSARQTTSEAPNLEANSHHPSVQWLQGPLFSGRGLLGSAGGDMPWHILHSCARQKGLLQTRDRENPIFIYISESGFHGRKFFLLTPKIEMLEGQKNFLSHERTNKRNFTGN